MKAFLKNNALWILGGLTMMLSIAFYFPIGGAQRTSYQALGDFTGSFDQRQGLGPEQKRNISQEPGSIDFLAAMIRKNLTPVMAAEVLEQVGKLAAPIPPLPKVAESSEKTPVGKHIRKIKKGRGGTPDTGGSISIAQQSLVRDTGDAASEIATRDSYESNLSKYPLDKTVWADGISLRLLGISPASGGKYVLKIAVTNNTGSDFFVKEITVADGSGKLNSRSFFRLFVEPGNTREGYVLFDKPETGENVKVVLKEDREKGRELSAPVNYPF